MSIMSGVWLIVGNIGGIRGESTGPGTKHFVHGAKVYVGRWSDGDVTSAPVIGHHRGGGRLVSLWMQSKHIVNLRVKLVRDPGVLRKAKVTMVGAFGDEADAREFMGRMEKART